jgi:integrase
MHCKPLLFATGNAADRARGALVHGLRHTFATELANADVSVYTLMKLLGHESMVTSQRYVNCGRHRDPNCRSRSTGY